MALSATDLLIGKLVTLLENEGTTIAGVRDEVDKIKLELQCMKAFLKDAEANKEKTEGQKLWISRIRDLAYGAEDIIDEFLYYMYEKPSGTSLSRTLHKIVSIPKTLWFRRNTAKRLREISEKIKAIAERNQRYDVGHVGGASTSEDSHKWVQNLANSSYYIMEEELVGIEDKKQILIGWLMDEAQHQTVISVVGMGGSGKTTLVAKTFTNEMIKRHFDCCAWITVSQIYVVEDLFRSLIKELHKSMREDLTANLNAMSHKELLEFLTNYLESKKYLIVLDDVWEVNVWREIKVALQDRRLGSRIILTTRKEEVASNSFGVESYVHHIQPLQKSDAWELFSKKAFSSNQQKTCTPELESLACQLVDKCRGLPLAIVCLSGLMSSKKSLDQWQQVCNSLNWHLDTNLLLDHMKNIMLLSFNDLPSRLKHCFLYCSLFPEDFAIFRNRLMGLWIAEGFVEHVKGATPEEVADSYLIELCFRSMLQVVERNEFGSPKNVKMHDLMRELALSTAEKEKFGHVYDGREAMEELSARRLAIHKMEGKIKPWPGMSKVRSLLVFGTSMSPSLFSNTLNSLVSEFKLLSTLDLEGVKIDKLPDAVVSLFNLRYLNLKGTHIKKLPESIGRLRNLQILIMSRTKIVSLPQGIAKLHNLRDLSMYCVVKISERVGQLSNDIGGIRAPSNICKLQELQCLTCVESDPEGKFVRLVGNMTQLKRISISNLKERDEADLWASIKKMTRLQVLSLRSSNEEVFPLKAESPPLPNIRRLALRGRLQNVAISWFSSLHSLASLDLFWCGLEVDILPQIEALPNLTFLNLRTAYVGEELCFRRGFTKLEGLKVADFPSLMNLTIEKGVMPSLHLLRVENCMGLKTVPLGLEYLSDLKTLELRDVPKEIVDPIRKGGADRPKVQHIPEITYVFEQASKRVYENLA